MDVPSDIIHPTPLPQPHGGLGVISCVLTLGLAMWLALAIGMLLDVTQAEACTVLAQFFHHFHEEHAPGSHCPLFPGSQKGTHATEFLVNLETSWVWKLMLAFMTLSFKMVLLRGIIVAIADL